MALGERREVAHRGGGVSREGRAQYPQVSPEMAMLRNHDRMIWLARASGWLRPATGFCDTRHPLRVDLRCLLEVGHDGNYHKAGIEDWKVWRCA